MKAGCRQCFHHQKWLDFAVLLVFVALFEYLHANSSRLQHDAPWRRNPEQQALLSSRITVNAAQWEDKRSWNTKQKEEQQVEIRKDCLENTTPGGVLSSHQFAEVQRWKSPARLNAGERHRPKEALRWTMATGRHNMQHMWHNWPGLKRRVEYC